MIRPIERDVYFLGQKSEEATRDDLSIGQDLQDTLRANKDRCVGMAANMIGIKKRIIIVNLGFRNLVMYNPVIKKRADHTKPKKAAFHSKVYAKPSGIRMLKWSTWMRIGKSRE